MLGMLHIAIIEASDICCNPGKEVSGNFLQIVAMADQAPKYPKHYLREWREFRELTQEQLAAALSPPTKASVISLLENRARDLGNKWLERLAPALRTSKGFILDMNPAEADTRVLVLLLMALILAGTFARPISASIALTVAFGKIRTASARLWS